MLRNSQIVALVGAAGIAVIVLGVILSQTQTTNDIIDVPLEKSTQDTIIDERLDEIEKEREETLEIIDLSKYEPNRPRPWITSGPFQIDRTEYFLGEKVFLRINELGYAEKGQVAFMRPLNATHYSVHTTIPFDGTEKPAFNYYMEPKLTKTRGICSVNDLVGKWTVVFRGTDYPNLKFNIINQTIPGTEDDFQPVC